MIEYLLNCIASGLTTAVTLFFAGYAEYVQPSYIQHVFDKTHIAAAALPQRHELQRVDLEELVPWKGKKIFATEFLEITHTQAFLAIHRGKLVHEWYANGVDEKTTLPSYSVAKSIVSLLAGQAIESGKLAEDATLVSVLPELVSFTDFDNITIRHLLDMQSGVDVSEEYESLIPEGTMLMALTTNLSEFIQDHRDMSFTPGTRSDYRSVDTQLLGMAVARAEGRSLSELLSERIWEPMGAEDGATWNLDQEGGQEKAFCCMNATARDFAKIGSLVLKGGVATNGKKIISPSWIKRLRNPVGNAIDEWGYAAQWWHFGQGDFGAVGIHGQYIYIDPDRDIVLVKLSNYGAEQDEKETVEAFRAISKALSGTIL